MNEYGFLRLTAASHKVTVGNPHANISEIINVIETHNDSDVIVFNELGVSGYTCRDLFMQNSLLDACEDAVNILCQETKRYGGLYFVGAPVRHLNGRYNCAIAIQRGTIVGIVPKTCIPNYKEFEEHRWFRSAPTEQTKCTWFAKQECLFGSDLIFRDRNSDAAIFAEVCEDLWMPIPPSSHAAISGANILLNLSASNEVIGKANYRKQLVTQQSGRCIAAYAYASSGPSESSDDLVFGGHLLIADDGHMLVENRNVGSGNPTLYENVAVTADIDVSKLQGDRRSMNSFSEQKPLREFRTAHITIGRKEHEGLKKRINGLVFIPQGDDQEVIGVAKEIFDIQVCGLAKRLSSINPEGMPVINLISGGIDSTVTALVTGAAYDLLEWPRNLVAGVTLPGFGTTSKTKSNALKLIEQMGFASDEVDIRPACMQAFRDQHHMPFGIDISSMSVEDFEKALQEIPSSAEDLIFENTQARYRTMHAMNRAFMIGTGDLSELLLGWCTYCADQQSMYNPNGGVPKTLMRFIIEYRARLESEANRELANTLWDINQGIISPELMPHQGDQIVQSTEDKIGPYEYNDFIGFHMIRHGFDPQKILYLAENAEWSNVNFDAWQNFAFDRALFIKTMKGFYKRFFSNQFKRSNMPCGPKVGSISLSPRGDWRMPTDADVSVWMNLLGKLS